MERSRLARSPVSWAAAKVANHDQILGAPMYVRSLVVINGNILTAKGSARPCAEVGRDVRFCSVCMVRGMSPRAGAETISQCVLRCVYMIRRSKNTKINCTL